MIALKLGGSVLTNKGAAGRPRFRALPCRRLLREVRRVADREPVILVLGAGSWGHPLALRYGVGKRAIGGGRLREALVRIQATVRALRGRVLAEAQRVGLTAADLPAGALAYSRRGELYFDAALLGRYADRGIVPITGGDVILDDRLGIRVLSGDEILEALALQLSPRRVVFVSDVDGIRVGRRIVERLTPAQAGALLPRVGRGRDSTAGMRGKLAHAARIAQRGVTVMVVNGNVPGRLRSACQGTAAVGTLLVRPVAAGAERAASGPRRRPPTP